MSGSKRVRRIEQQYAREIGHGGKSQQSGGREGSASDEEAYHGEREGKTAKMRTSESDKCRWIRT
jgi:hypothetical protein